MNEEITTEEKYYYNGNLNYRINYKDGKKYGVYKQCYINGNIECRINFKNGKRHGLCEWWWNDGTLRYREWDFNDKLVTEFEFDVLETNERFNG